MQHGYTPLDHAKAHKHDAVCALLEAHAKLAAFLSINMLSEFLDGIKEEGYVKLEVLADLSADSLNELGKTVGMRVGHVLNLKTALLKYKETLFNTPPQPLAHQTSSVNPERLSYPSDPNSPSSRSSAANSTSPASLISDAPAHTADSGMAIMFHWLGSIPTPRAFSHTHSSLTTRVLSSQNSHASFPPYMFFSHLYTHLHRLGTATRRFI